MKKYSLLAATAILFASSCTVKVDTSDKAGSNEEKTETTAGAKTAAVKDPVCNMEKDATWTEFTANGSDTTWFCSPHCKETFAKKQGAKPEEGKKG